MPPSTLDGLAHAIQLAVAPVFLLSGIAALLAVLTNRLARIIDRLRSLQTEANERAAREAAILGARIRSINRAITFCTYGALLVAGVVATMFVGVVFGVDLTAVVATAFVLAMGALIAGLTSFLAEIHLTTRQWRAELRRP